MLGVRDREPSAFGKKGPNSEKSPPLSDEHPGPPSEGKRGGRRGVRCKNLIEMELKWCIKGASER